MNLIDPKRYAVIGAGALGGYYGGLLCRAGHQVSFLVRSHRDVIRQRGIFVESKDGDFQVMPNGVYDSSKDLPPVDRVIIAIKSTENEKLAEILPPLCDTPAFIVLQNGLNIEEDTARLVGNEKVIGGCCFLCSNKVAPGHIRHLDYGHISLGAYRGTGGDRPMISQQIVHQIANEFQQSGIATAVADDLRYARWKKLMWNIPFNGLSVAMNASTDAVMHNPYARRLAWDLMKETQLAAAACGILIADEELHQMMTYTEAMVPYDSSMRLDYLAGRPMEIEAIFGNPLRESIKAAYTPRKIEMLYQQLNYLSDHRDITPDLR